VKDILEDSNTSYFKIKQSTKIYCLTLKMKTLCTSKRQLVFTSRQEGVTSQKT